MEISRETFKGSDNSTQNLTLFDSINALNHDMADRDARHQEKHDKLDKHIRSSGKVNKTISAGSGLLGGFIAVVSAKLFGI
jgi:hypothetical protein